MYQISKLKGGVREKWKGVLAWCDKKALLIATNFTSIWCVYKEKNVKVKVKEVVISEWFVWN